MNPSIPLASRRVSAILALYALLITVVPAFGQNQKKKIIADAKEKAAALVGNAAPEFTLPDQTGQTFRLSDTHGKVVVLAFWATWCPPCRSEMPGLAKLQTELESQGVTLALIAFDEPDKARDFLAKKKLDATILLDPGGKVAKLYGALSLPRTFVIDANGKVVKTTLGKTSESDLRHAIAAAR
jgi:peroxiredoxin